MNKYLPSKKFLKIIGIAVLGGGLLIFLGFLFSRDTEFFKKENTSIGVTAENFDFFEKDSDGDGLFDWEEALWKTDPNKKDTDGDGVDDKKFVENSRQELDLDTSYVSDPENQTELLAKQFFVTAVSLEQSGGFDQESIENISYSINQSVGNFNIKEKYNLSDIKMSQVSASNYYNEMSRAFSSLNNLSTSELEVIGRVLNSPEDPETISSLSNIITAYSNLEKDLLLVNVPYTISGTHLSTINNINKISLILSEIKNIENDPLKATLYLSKYDEYSTAMLNNLDLFTSYFEQNGIIN